MSVTVKIAGKTYMPLAAVPYVTGGFLGISTVAHMISHPEAYCDADNSTVLSAYRVTDEGRLVVAPYCSFRTLADLGLSGYSRAPSSATAGVVVPEESMFSLYRTVLHGLTDAGGLDPNGCRPFWDRDAPLPAEIYSECFENIVKPVDRHELRANSKRVKANNIAGAVGVIEGRAAAAGMPLDRRNLPGRMRDFLRLLRKVDPAAGIDEANFKRHYKRALGLAWRQGSKPKDAQPLLALFGLAIDRTP